VIFIADDLTIVVGYDGSDPARRGLGRIRRSSLGAGRLVIVAVTPRVRQAAVTDEPLVGGDFDAERVLAEARTLLGKPEGITVETRTAAGDPAAVLVDVTHEMNADLLIVGRHGADFVTRALLGPVAGRVVLEASCDVLVVA
jgi:nucleotide-binding universal stress UspA family protein